MRRIAVVYDIGAASPVDIITSLEGIARPVFILPASEHNARIRDLLDDVAEVRDLDNVAKARVKGVISFSDFQLESAAVVAEQLGLPFHSVKVARSLTRKHTQRTILNDSGVGCTPTALITDVASARLASESMAFPAVLKPNRGFGGTDTYPVNDCSELLALTARLMPDGRSADDGYVLESRITPVDTPQPWGSFVSVESVVRSGEVFHLGVTGKFSLFPPFRERGGYLPVRPEAVNEAAVLNLTSRALRALGVGDSICHTEIMLTRTGPQVIEVNGRLGGHIHDLFERAHTINLIALAARIALGDPAPVSIEPCDHVVYHYFGLAPMTAKTLVQVSSVAQVRDDPAVVRLDVMVPPGSDLDWRRGFRERLYICRGQVPDHNALASFVGSLDERLGIRFA